MAEDQADCCSRSNRLPARVKRCAGRDASPPAASRRRASIRIRALTSHRLPPVQDAIPRTDRSPGQASVQDRQGKAEQGHWQHKNRTPGVTGSHHPRPISHRPPPRLTWRHPSPLQSCGPKAIAPPAAGHAMRCDALFPSSPHGFAAPPAYVHRCFRASVLLPVPLQFFETVMHCLCLGHGGWGMTGA